MPGPADEGGAWERRDQVATAIFAVFGAAGLFLAALGHGWAKTAGVLVAAAGLVAALWRLWVVFQQSRRKRKTEERDAARRYRVPVADIDIVDQLKLGVERSCQQILPGGEVPDYQARPAVDSRIEQAIIAALQGWLKRERDRPAHPLRKYP